MRPSWRATLAMLAILTTCTGLGAQRTLHRTASPSTPPFHQRVADPFRWEAKGQLIGVHGGRAYLGNGGQIAAYELSCRSTCEPVWRAMVDGWPLDLAFFQDRVFVPADRNGIAVYPRSCARERCSPLFSLRFGMFDPASSFDNARENPPTLFRLTVIGSLLYVIGELDLGDTSGIQPGRLFLFDASCTGPCRALWKGPVTDGLLHVPTIRDDNVYLPSSNGLSVFPAECRTDGGICSPLWTAPMNTEAAFGMLMAPPVFVGDLVVELTDGYVGGGDTDVPQIAAFPTGCRSDGRSCEPTWWYEVERERFANGPVIHDDEAFITTGGGNPLGMTFAFPLDCTGLCPPSRIFHAPGEFFRGPTFAGGRLVTGAFSGGRISIFDPRCRSLRCSPLGG